MRLIPWLVLLAKLTAAAPAAAGPSDCPVAGENIHWIADYCMALLETDDEIPASPCMAGELGKSFASDCAAKIHYKLALCELSLRLGQRHDGMDACLADPGFVGATVRNGGVGRR